MGCELYRHWGSNGELLYIGISLSTVARLKQHEEYSVWFKDLARVTIEHFSCREDALKAERDAINNEHPLHNIHHNKGLEEPPEVSIPAENSKRLLYARIVKFYPVYTLEEVGNVLGIGKTAVKHLVNEGKLGHVMIPSTRKVHCKITGWQLLDYLESLMAEDKPQ